MSPLHGSHGGTPYPLPSGGPRAPLTFNTRISDIFDDCQQTYPAKGWVPPVSELPVVSGGMSSKTPAHTLIRVRNNQRRHRARRQEYISSLEQRLQEAESLLAAAQEEIMALKEKLAAQSNSATEAVPQARSSSGVASAQLESSLPSDETSSPVLAGSAAYSAEDTVTLWDPAQLDPLLETASSEPDAPTQQLAEPTQTVCCLTDNDLSMQRWAGVTVSEQPPDLASDCTYAISEGRLMSEESTTLCSTAYALVEQQNRLGLSFSAVTEWLWRGFRSAKADETGCRVENNLLFGLLDFVSDG